MSLSKKDIVQQILTGKTFSPNGNGEAYAPANIALSKYWGKRDVELHLPVSPSISVSLQTLGTRTKISAADAEDLIVFNGKTLDPESRFSRRLRNYLDLFRSSKSEFFNVSTVNSVPTGAGVASSASGFAALVLALNDFYQWKLNTKELSILARLGSGSACRSIEHGFVQWHMGVDETGTDSFGERVNITWPEFRVGLCLVNADKKAISSREAMETTRTTSALYALWPERATSDTAEILSAIQRKDFTHLGEVAEQNALTMHATMFSSRPAICYWEPKTLEVLHAVWELRKAGVQLYATLDAGPNVKLLFLESAEEEVRKNFADVQIVSPFNAHHN